jgi:septum formation protein
VGRIVLASASPRRRDLLEAAGLRFEIAPAAVPEELEPFVDPLEAALELAARKARQAARGRPDGFVIGADTVVAVPSDGGWRLLGKAEDALEARAMLELLSNSRHVVATGVCVVRCPDLEQRSGVERTWVTMRPIEPAEVEAYVASGEWRGKAGGYAIQENADAFVTSLEEGGFDNVVGLPVELTLRLLRESGAPQEALPGG